jgi:hypothetical protein
MTFNLVSTVSYRPEYGAHLTCDIPHTISSHGVAWDQTFRRRPSSSTVTWKGARYIQAPGVIQTPPPHALTFLVFFLQISLINLSTSMSFLFTFRIPRLPFPNPFATLAAEEEDTRQINLATNANDNLHLYDSETSRVSRAQAQCSSVSQHFQAEGGPIANPRKRNRTSLQDHRYTIPTQNTYHDDPRNTLFESSLTRTRPSTRGEYEYDFGEYDYFSRSILSQVHVLPTICHLRESGIAELEACASHFVFTNLKFLFSILLGSSGLARSRCAPACTLLNSYILLSRSEDLTLRPSTDTFILQYILFCLSTFGRDGCIYFYSVASLGSRPPNGTFTIDATCDRPSGIDSKQTRSRRRGGRASWKASKAWYSRDDPCHSCVGRDRLNGRRVHRVQIVSSGFL